MSLRSTIDNIYKRWKDIKEYIDTRNQYNSLIDRKDLTDDTDSKLSTKQDKLVAGKNITISGNTISAKGGETYKAGQNIDISNNTISTKGYVWDENNKAFGEGLVAGTGIMSHTEGGEYCEVLVRILQPWERDEVYNETGIWYDYVEVQDNIPNGATGVLIYNNKKYNVTESEYVQIPSSGIDVDVFNTGTPVKGLNEYDAQSAVFIAANIASDYASHAEGYYTTASGEAAHAEGSYATASDYASHAEGANTTALGSCSHAEGYYTTASGISSHTEGRNVTASGFASHAEGYYTIADSSYAHAEGKYNTTHIGITGSTGPTTSTIHSTGIGTSDIDRKNAFEIMDNGDVYVKGIGGYDGTNPGNAQTLQQKFDYYDNQLANIIISISGVTGATGATGSSY